MPECPRVELWGAQGQWEGTGCEKRGEPVQQGGRGEEREMRGSLHNKLCSLCFSAHKETLEIKMHGPRESLAPGTLCTFVDIRKILAMV